MTPMRIKLLTGGKLPTYATDGAAGIDCYATDGGKLSRPTYGEVGRATDGGFQPAFDGRRVIISRALVGLGFCIEIPPGYEGQIRPRSGLGLRHGIHVATGTIDADYRGEVKALVYNLGDEHFEWPAGERICQFVIAPVLRAELQVHDDLSETERGAAGFGSTGSR